MIQNKFWFVQGVTIQAIVIAPHETAAVEAAGFNSLDHHYPGPIEVIELIPENAHRIPRCYSDTLINCIMKVERKL